MIKEDRIKVKSDDVELGATVAYNTSEREKMPLILLISGTGNLDRDGNSKMIKLNFYKDLSDNFVNQGYVCVRYDKRGTHESTGNYSKNSLTNLVDDAKAILDHCKTFPQVDTEKVIVCGHSEGTMIATLLSEKTKTDGLILLGGAGMSLKEAMLNQNDIILNEAKNGKGFTYWLLRKTVTPEKVHKQLDDLYAKAANCSKDRFFYRGAIFGTKYFQEHNSRTGDDYVEILKNYDGKILAITGKKDLQADYTALEKLNELKHAETFAPENANHILKEVSANDNNSILNVQKQYKKQNKQPLQKETLDCIFKWITKNFTNQKSNNSGNLESESQPQTGKNSAKNQSYDSTNSEKLNLDSQQEM